MNGLVQAIPFKRHHLSYYPVVSLTGLYRGLEWVLECRKKEEYLYHWTVDCLFPAPIHLVIYSESLGLPSRLLLSMHELHWPEEPDFESRYLVFSTIPERAAKAVNRSLRAKLMALAGSHFCMECDHEGLRGKLDSKRPLTVDELKDIYALFAQFLHVLVHEKMR